MKPKLALPAEDRASLLTAEGMRQIYARPARADRAVELSRARSPPSVCRRRASSTWSVAPGPAARLGLVAADAMTVEAKDVVVIGGGFAGLSAGVALAEAGFRVALLESKPALGGRAYSFADPESGDFVDNGQHVLMGCYHRDPGFSRPHRHDDESGFPPRPRDRDARSRRRRAPCSRPRVCRVRCI